MNSPGRCGGIPPPLLFLVIIFVLILLLPSVSAAAHPEKNVLLLHSYHEGLSWTDGITESIYSTFEGGNTDVNLYIEYMDTPRITSPSYSAEIAEMYRLKYADVTIDAIICSDEYAFHFLREHHDALFPGTPVIFCGVNYFEDEYLAGWENCTGIVEVTDVEGTIGAALHLNPDVRMVYVVNDRTLTGIADLHCEERHAEQSWSRRRSSTASSPPWTAAGSSLRRCANTSGNTEFFMGRGRSSSSMILSRGGTRQ